MHKAIVRHGAGAGMLAAGLLGATSLASAADVTYERLLNPEPENWLMNNQTYSSNRYSTLDQITRENVANLRPIFMIPLAPPEYSGSRVNGTHATPLVDNGIMYMTDGWGRVYMIDLTEGDRALIRWIMDPQTPRDTDGIKNNRGVALLGNTVYSTTLDGLLIATDATTGEVLWNKPTEVNPLEYFTMSPTALDGKIIHGPAGGELQIQARLEAFDADNGDLLWTFNVIPSAGEPGYETWAPGTAEVGGGSVWHAGSYDPESNLLIWGTGNPRPDWDPQLRAGDNLYTDSTIALNADTGELVWYFQMTPNDSWDFDEVGSQLLFEVDGRLQVGHFGRNGFYYQLNGDDGSFLRAQQYVDEVTWTAGIDAKTGKPVEYDPNLDLQQYLRTWDAAGANIPGAFCPYWEGGVNFFPTSYSQRTGYVYGTAMEGCSDRGAPAGNRAVGKLTGSVTAIDTVTGEIVGKHRMNYIGRGGVLTTATGLVFSASINGDFFALDDETLEPLWNFNVGTGIEAPPITFEVNGKQIVALAVGPGGLGLGQRYAFHGDDPNAAAQANQQSQALMIFFGL